MVIGRGKKQGLLHKTIIYVTSIPFSRRFLLFNILKRHEFPVKQIYTTILLWAQKNQTRACDGYFPIKKTLGRLCFIFPYVKFDNLITNSGLSKTTALVLVILLQFL